jgi:hypothetical protein
MVIEAFMKAYESVKGFFGIKFLGNKWRCACVRVLFVCAGCL